MTLSIYKFVAANDQFKIDPFFVAATSLSEAYKKSENYHTDFVCAFDKIIGKIELNDGYTINELVINEYTKL
jgi:hypothetical protein